jgi:hypothetical protein
MPNIVVTYGQGDPKKGSVRMKPIHATEDIDPSNLGDIYVSRDIMKSLGIKDSGTIEVTYANPDNPLI